MKVLLNKVSDEYERWFGVHLKTEKKITEEFLSTLGSAGGSHTNQEFMSGL